MKHMKVLSNVKPKQAEVTAWVQFKNVFGTLPLTANQSTWVLSQIDQALQK